LAFNQLGDEGVRHIADCALPGLQELDLASNDIGLEGIRHLDGSPHLAQLTRLDLGYNKIGDEEVKILAGSVNLKRIRFLQAEQNQIGDEGLEAIASSQHFGCLENLILRNNPNHGIYGARQLGRSQNLNSLWNLDIGDSMGSSVSTDRMVRALLEEREKTGGLPMLEIINRRPIQELQAEIAGAGKDGGRS